MAIFRKVAKGGPRKIFKNHRFFARTSEVWFGLVCLVDGFPLTIGLSLKFFFLCIKLLTVLLHPIYLIF